MRFKNLDRYKLGGTSARMQLGVPLPQTPDGRVYRYSPNEQAHPRHFVLGNRQPGFVATEAASARMKLQPGSTQTVCPYSGIIADDGEFEHPDDRDAALKTIGHAFFADAQEHVSKMLKDSARGQRHNSALKITVSSTGKAKPKPRFTRKDLLRELVCDHCGRDFGVYAIGLFCPDCGAPNLRLHFAREVELVRQQVDMAEAQDKGSQELSYRLLGNAHEDVLTAFEATLKTVYLHKVAQSGQPGKPPKNDFQNVDFGRTRFAEFGFDPFAELRPKELSVLVLNIQKRHVIGHNLGVVDSKFAQHATDARLGETVKLVGVDIRAFAEISQRVVDRLDDWVADIVRPASNNGTLGVAVENDPSVPDETTLDNVPGDLGNLARKLGRWIAEQSKDGMLDHVDEDAVLSAFEGEPDGELEIAIAELEADGYVSDRATMNSRLPHFAPTLDLFVTFDPVVSENNPLEDAVGLIERIFKSGDSVDVRELHQSTGWSARRFNPAVSLVITEIDEGRVSQESANDYPARHFAIAAEDRVALRRFAKRIRG